MRSVRQSVDRAMPREVLRWVLLLTCALTLALGQNALAQENAGDALLASLGEGNLLAAAKLAHDLGVNAAQHDQDAGKIQEALESAFDRAMAAEADADAAKLFENSTWALGQYAPVTGRISPRLFRVLRRPPNKESRQHVRSAVASALTAQSTGGKDGPLLEQVIDSLKGESHGFEIPVIIANGLDQLLAPLLRVLRTQHAKGRAPASAEGDTAQPAEALPVAPVASYLEQVLKEEMYPKKADDPLLEAVYTAIATSLAQTLGNEDVSGPMAELLGQGALSQARKSLGVVPGSRVVLVRAMSERLRTGAMANEWPEKEAALLSAVLETQPQIPATESEKDHPPESEGRNASETEAREAAQAVMLVHQAGAGNQAPSGSFACSPNIIRAAFRLAAGVEQAPQVLQRLNEARASCPQAPGKPEAKTGATDCAVQRGLADVLAQTDRAASKEAVDFLGKNANLMLFNCDSRETLFRELANLVETGTEPGGREGGTNDGTPLGNSALGALCAGYAHSGFPPEVDFRNGLDKHVLDALIQAIAAPVPDGCVWELAARLFERAGTVSSEVSLRIPSGKAWELTWRLLDAWEAPSAQNADGGAWLLILYPGAEVPGEEPGSRKKPESRDEWKTWWQTNKNKLP